MADIIGWTVMLIDYGMGNLNDAFHSVWFWAFVLVMVIAAGGHRREK